MALYQANTQRADEGELACDQPIGELKAEQTRSRGQRLAHSQQQEARNGDEKEEHSALKKGGI